MPHYRAAISLRSQRVGASCEGGNEGRGKLSEEVKVEFGIKRGVEGAVEGGQGRVVDEGNELIGEAVL